MIIESVLFIVGSLAFFEVTSPCPGVIGVVYNQQGIVRDVFRGSPADKSGVEIGDLILDKKSTKGKPGTTATVKYIRSGELNKTKITRICVNELERGGW